MPIRHTLFQGFLQNKSSSQFWLNCFFYLCLGLTFWPTTKWFAQNAYEQTRILHALVVLLFASVLLVRFNKIQIVLPFTLNRSARNCLISAYGLLLICVLIQQFSTHYSQTLKGLLALMSIPAYCLALASVILFIFGEKTKRITITVAGTLCAFLTLSTLIGTLDWPLRVLAGKWSAQALELIGKSVQLGLHTDQTEGPQLILLVNQHPFHVASECNGFGVILTSLLIALLLAIYRRLKWFDFLLNLIAGVVLGFAFNVARIVIIVLLAPSVPDHYHLMHEIVGTITYWGCLALVWIVLNGPIKDESIDEPPPPQPVGD